MKFLSMVVAEDDAGLLLVMADRLAGHVPLHAGLRRQQINSRAACRLDTKYSIGALQAVAGRIRGMTWAIILAATSLRIGRVSWSTRGQLAC